MRQKNETPLLFAAKACSRKPPEPEATIIVKGTFQIVPDGVATAVEETVDQLMLSGDVYDESDEESDDERGGECVYASDFADFKLSGEVLFRGSCHTPHGRELRECPVMLKVGAWSKNLRVVGQRFWSDGLIESHTEPAPFTTMPIRWSNAFGGPASEANPAGRGWGTLELPTIEAAKGPVGSRSDRPEPGSLGPINPRWAARASKTGKEYGKRWLAARFPWFAEDFDWTYFNAAPVDQRIAGYFAGDEELVLQNLSPLAPIVKTRLPGIRPRVFVEDDGGSTGTRKRREVPLVLDTVFVDGERGLVALVWRGVTSAREDDLVDLVHALVVTEPLASQPKPAAGYLEALRAFGEDPVEIKGKLPADLPPDFLDGKKPAPAPLDAPDPISALLDARLGGFQREQRDRVREMLRPVVEDAEKKAKIVEALRKNEVQAEDEPPIPRPGAPGTFPELHLRRKMRKIVETTTKARASVAERELPPAHAVRLAELEKVPFDPKLKTFDPFYTPPVEPISTEEPGPGRDLSEQDLTGRDLSGLDLRGANLRQAVLTRANLRGADLRGADLHGAVLFKADATGANFDDANLTRANAARLVADGASFQRAKLDQTFFEDAALGGARLEEASGGYAVFTRAALDGASLARASLSHADFEAASLAGACLARGAFERASFTRAKAAKIDLGDARVEGATFDGADLTDANLAGAAAKHAFFPSTRLVRADLSFAVLVEANLPSADATQAKFFSANLAGARLRRARLDRAELVAANLFGADLSKTSLHHAKFTDANLYEANLLGASGTGADFVGANLKKSTLEILS
jgi:uncharacterized protein YjbI with pentapeptide repeats